MTADALRALRTRIEAHARANGRDPAGIRLVAVTKEQTPGVLPWLRAAGIADAAENRIEHALEMAAAAPDLHWHFIGRLQSRQIPRIVPWAGTVHSLADPAHAPLLARAAAAAGRRIAVFVQVNISGETAKSGGDADTCARAVAAVRACPELDAVGLMTMAPRRTDGNAALIADLFARCAALAAALGLPRTSMGMSLDWDLAVAAGATDLRIGSALFAGGA